VPSLYVRVPEYERMSVFTDGSYFKVANISSSRLIVFENGSITETIVATKWYCVLKNMLHIVFRKVSANTKSYSEFVWDKVFSITFYI